MRAILIACVPHCPSMVGSPPRSWRSWHVETPKNWTRGGEPSVTLMRDHALLHWLGYTRIAVIGISNDLLALQVNGDSNVVYASPSSRAG